MTARRTPRATALEVTVSSGERIRLDGQRAAVLAYIAAELLKRPHLEAVCYWRFETDVSDAKVFCKFGDTAAAWGFRDEFTA